MRLRILRTVWNEMNNTYGNPGTRRRARQSSHDATWVASWPLDWLDRALVVTREASRFRKGWHLKWRGWYDVEWGRWLVKIKCRVHLKLTKRYAGSWPRYDRSHVGSVLCRVSNTRHRKMGLGMSGCLTRLGEIRGCCIGLAIRYRSDTDFRVGLVLALLEIGQKG